MMEKISAVVERIQNESIEKLQDPGYLEFKLLPALGLNDRHIGQYPSHLHPHCGGGIDSWQYPNQFSRYLHFLSNKKIQSYVEIGCHKGGTFIITVEYLSRFTTIERAIAVDNWPRDIMHEYQSYRPCIEYITDSSQSAGFREAYQAHHAWDLVLIDGDHSYQGARSDYEMVQSRAKFVAFHDVKNILCPGTQQIWADMKKQHAPDRLQEWSDQYDDVLLRLRGSVMGIGLVETL